MKDMDIFNGTSEETTPGPVIPALLSSSLPHFTGPCPDGTLYDFDLLEQVIGQDNERSGSSLPGPPPPPAALVSPPVHSQNHRTLQQTSKPLLVPRGTACKPNFSSQQPPFCSSREMESNPTGSFRCGRGSSCSLSAKSSVGVSSQNQGNSEIPDRILEKPKLVIVEEPKDRGMRFRYECEGRSAGSILGASSTDTNKTQPAIEIQGPIDLLKKVIVTVSLVTKDLPHRPHPHCLVGKDCPNGSGICLVTINPHSNRRHSFASLGIQCVRRKELDISLQKRRSQNIDPFHTGHTKGIEDIDMNAVRLCFQCELEWKDGMKDSLSPVVSTPIYDKKATTTSQLKISALNQYRGSCTGRTEIYMLCDKVQKDDIEIIFRRGSWKANGEFAQTDVHRQIAIVFKTPPYQDQDINEEVKVNMILRRISDQMESEPVTFTYLPHNRDPYDVKRKRKMKSDIGFTEKSCATESAPVPEQDYQFQMETQSMMSTDERPCVAQPGAPALPDTHYMDSHPAIDESAIISELLQSPEFLNILSNASSMSCGFELTTNTASSFANMDINFNPNFEVYQQQDFSQYSDVQFNMLVNENQNQQPEPQESMVQVKTEEEQEL
ncbi:transcription factor RelB homolog [Parambassis ranga]|uniref:Transcription factor RelB homolog n=1 Tax=Parambassis ranga TaxID=210632 RepID=A0A6P7JGR9_9TELE|nr:transcription factor RelB homolog [Parambassis ranga]